MDSLVDKVVMITGASSGIGEAVAREAARQGASVVLCARRAARLDEVAHAITAQGGRALAVRCDVTREADLERAVTAATQQFGGIDVLVANAGSGLQGTLAELSVDDYRRQFEVNVFGVLATIKAGLPALEKARGAVGVVGSANGYLSLPGWSAYCMSKHAVRSLCASARHELAPRGISVTHLTLGFVESEFRKLDNAGGLRPGARDPVPDFLVMAPDKAARAILKALTKRVEEAVITRHARLVVGLERHAPRLVSAALGVSGPLIRAFGRQT